MSSNKSSKAEREEKPVSEYGEPWNASNATYPSVQDRHGAYLVQSTTKEKAHRIVACVNALAGIPNPEAWVADVRDLLWELKFYDEHADGSTLGFNWGIIQKRLAALSTPSPRPQQQ